MKKRLVNFTLHKKMKFSIKDFASKYDQIRRSFFVQCYTC